MRCSEPSVSLHEMRVPSMSPQSAGQLSVSALSLSALGASQSDSSCSCRAMTRMLLAKSSMKCEYVI